MNQSSIVHMAACILADINVFKAKVAEKNALEESNLNV